MNNDHVTEDFVWRVAAGGFISLTAKESAGCGYDGCDDQDWSGALREADLEAMLAELRRWK